MPSEDIPQEVVAGVERLQELYYYRYPQSFVRRLHPQYRIYHLPGVGRAIPNTSPYALVIAPTMVSHICSVGNIYHHPVYHFVNHYPFQYHLPHRL